MNHLRKHNVDRQITAAKVAGLSHGALVSMALETGSDDVVLNLPCDGSEPWWQIPDFVIDRLGENLAKSSKPKIYVIRNMLTGSVKIGVSKDPGRRLRGMQTGCDGRLSIVRVFESEDAYSDEAKIHKSLSDFRIRGEWFDVDVGSIERALSD